MESTFPLEFGEQAACMEINPKYPQMPKVKEFSSDQQIRISRSPMFEI
jgi:hypothetical protein